MATKKLEKGVEVFEHGEKSDSTESKKVVGFAKNEACPIKNSLENKGSSLDNNSHEADQEICCVIEAVPPAIKDTIQETATRAHSKPHPVLVSVHYSNYPVYAHCMECQETVLTKVFYAKPNRFWIAWLFACLCWICVCWVPLVTNIFLDVMHRCPNCDKVIAKVDNKYLGGEREKN